MAENGDRPGATVYLFGLTVEERATLIRTLRCIQDNWVLDPLEDLLLVRLEALPEAGPRRSRPPAGSRRPRPVPRRESSAPMR